MREQKQGLSYYSESFTGFPFLLEYKNTISLQQPPMPISTPYHSDLICSNAQHAPLPPPRYPSHTGLSAPQTLSDHICAWLTPSSPSQLKTHFISGANTILQPQIHCAPTLPILLPDTVFLPQPLTPSNIARKKNICYVYYLSLPTKM